MKDEESFLKTEAEGRFGNDSSNDGVFVDDEGSFEELPLDLDALGSVDLGSYDSTVPFEERYHYAGALGGAGAVKDFASDLGESLQIDQAERTSTWRLLCLAAFWGTRGAWYAAAQVLLTPDQVAILMSNFPQARDVTLGMVTFLAAVSNVVAFPYFGLLSDRTSIRRRLCGVLPASRRLHFVLLGSVLRFFTILFIATAIYPTVFLVPVMIIGYFFDSLFDGMSGAPYMAMLPDGVAEKQWGTASGWIGLAVMLGNTLGGGLLGIFFEGWHQAVHASFNLEDDEDIRQIFALNSAVAAAYVILSVIVLAGTLITVFGAPPARESISEHPDVDDWGWRWKYGLWNPRFLWSFIKQLFHPFRSMNFVWVFVTRFLFTAGFQVIVVFVKYYSDDTRDCEENEDECMLFGYFIESKDFIVGLFIVAVSLGSILSVFVSGFLSDYVGRKPVILVCGVIMSVTIGVILFLADILEVFISVGFVFGMGYGGYISVDYALIADHLPSSEDTARDMGIWHISWSLPSLLSPLVGGILLTVLKPIDIQLAYSVVFGLAAACVLMGSVLVYCIRPPRPKDD